MHSQRESKMSTREVFIAQPKRIEDEYRRDLLVQQKVIEEIKKTTAKRSGPLLLYSLYGERICYLS